MRRSPSSKNEVDFFSSLALGSCNPRKMQIRRALSPEVLTEEQFYDETLNTGSLSYGRPLPKKMSGRAPVTQAATRQLALSETSEKGGFAKSRFEQCFPCFCLF